MDHYKNNPAAGLENILLQEKTAKLGKEKPGRMMFESGVEVSARFLPVERLGTTGIPEALNKPCRVLARFSTMSSEPSPELGAKGLALKFFDGDRPWDLVCSSIPIFALEDGLKFPEYLQSLENTDDSSAEWEFYGSHPETLHYLLMANSGRALQKSFSSMDAYSGSTFSFLKDNGEKLWVKFHLKSNQPQPPLTCAEAKATKENAADYYQTTLKQELATGKQLGWTLYIQTISEAEAKAMPFNPFDATKVWPHADAPLQKIGEIFLEGSGSALPGSVHTAFSPAHVPYGMGFSPDRLLLSRLAVYGNAQRARLGADYPAATDFGAFEEAIKALEGTESEYSHYPPSDPYIQAGHFYTKALKTEQERHILAENIIESMNRISSPRRLDIINRQFCHFFRANVELGIRIATGLNINIDYGMMAHTMG